MAHENMYDRVRERIARLTPFMASPAGVFGYLVRAKFDKTAAGRGTYKNMPFSFLPPDMSAIWEVLGEKEYSFLSPLLAGTERPVILDVGAHIGLFGLWALGENARAHLLSVEASPSTFRTLQANVAGSGKNASWSAVNAAGWSDNSSVSFAAVGDSMGHKVSDTGGDRVQGMTLERMADALLESAGAERITVLKIDIEGSEEAFLTAGEHVLPKIDSVVIELHPRLCDTDKVRGILARHYRTIAACADESARKPLLFCSDRASA